MDKLIETIKGFDDTIFLILLIGFAVAVLLTVVFFIAMLVNRGKSGKAAKSTDTAGASTYAKLQKQCDELEKERVDKNQQEKVLQEKVWELERKQKGSAESAQFYEGEFKKMRERAASDQKEVEALQKQVETLQKENAKLKEKKPAKDLTLEEVIDKSVFEEEKAAKPKAPAAAAKPKAEPKTAAKPKAPATAKPAAAPKAKAADEEITGVYEVVFDQEKEDWVVRKRGGQRATRRFRTKDEAVQYSKEVANNQNAGLAIHKKDGKFQKS